MTSEYFEQNVPIYIGPILFAPRESISDAGMTKALERM
jgi:hypothetical protein